MQRCSGLIVVGVLAASTSAVRADVFDVRTVPAAQTPSAADTAIAPAHPADVVVDRGEARRTIALWTAVGGGALVASAISLSLVERGRYDAALARGDVDAANSAQRTAAYTGTALFVGGAVTLGVAAALYVTAPKLRERHVIVAPIAGSDHVGVAFGGGF